jgi:hypothetical protein
MGVNLYNICDKKSGNRYFWRIGAKTKFSEGFSSKEQADNWK